jgi:hypothetical protein
MSLFRSLQNSPATISIFHNNKVSLSNELYLVLDKAYYKLNDDKNYFQVDLMANKMPTYDQFLLITNSCLKDRASKLALRNCYPFMYGKKSGEINNKITVESPIRPNNGDPNGLNVFSEGEYAMIYESFNKLIETKEPDVNPSDIFQAPLIVDWDQCLIAADKEGLSSILSKYGG